MKKFRSILIISAVLCAACETGVVDNAILSWDYQEPEYWIRTSASKLEFTSSGGEEPLTVQLSHSQLWTVDTSDCPWVTLTPTSGTGSTDITATVAAYNRSGVRSGNMVFSFREKKTTVAVSQTGFAYLTTNPYIEKLEFPAEGGTSSLWLESNQEWTATASDSWILVSPPSGTGSDSVRVVTNQNTTTETRSGTVTFKSDDCETTLAVVQEGVQLFIDGHAYVNLGLPSGLLWATMNVGASAPEESGGYYAWGETEEKGNYTWETLKYCARGDDNSNVMFSKYVTLYSRGPVDHRTILESSDDAAASNWGGRWLTPTHDDWTELKEKCSWALSSGYKGYIVTGPNGRSIFLPMAGYFYGTNLYSAGTAGFYWSSTLDVNHPWCAMEIEMWNSQTIKQENGTRYWGRSIRPVLQPSSYFSVSTQSLDFPSAGGTREITLTTNILWEVSADAVWLTVSAPSGKGTTTLTVTAEENTSTQSRTGNITFEAGNSTYVVSVTQDAAEAGSFSVSPSSLSFSSSGGEETLRVSSNRSWTTTISDTWIDLYPTSGTGDATLTVTADVNTSANPRTGSITFEAGGNTYQVTVTQKAAEQQQDGEINGHAYVNLDLPSGLLWATVNVGASIAEDIGDYYAWGETEPKSNYSWSTYKWCDGSSSTITKYQNDSSLGMAIGILEYSDDAAWVNWGGGWRMPTYGEWDELTSTSYCTWTWTTQDGQSGYRVTSRANGKSIFLPAGGFRESTSLTNIGSFGNYWSSTLFAEKRDYGRYTYFNSSAIGCYYCNRSNGQSVRPVYQPSPYFILSAKNVSFTASGGTNKNVVLTTNLPWTATPSASWITISATSGTGNKGIAITADANTSTQSRTGNITFEAGNSTYVVSVTQDAADAGTLSVAPSSLFFSSFGGEETLNVTSNRSWITTISDTWIDLYPTSGSGDATLTVTADVNTSADPRTGNITFEAGGITYQVTVTQKAAGQQQDGEINGHAYVDLGLPSGTLWATTNVGASSPADYGDYFAWGETDGGKYLSQIGYNDMLKNYKWGVFTEGKGISLTKYNNDSNKGTVDNKTTLDLSDDAARANWGGSWRMPTISEWNELLDEFNCKWTWTTKESVEGYVIVSKMNGNSIFLPAARDPLYTELEAFGNYWSSSLNSDDSFFARGIDFDSSERKLLITKVINHHPNGDTYTYMDGIDRWITISVRPVCRP